MHNLLISLLGFFLFTVSSGFTQNRKEIHIPDILGYKTLKCDFHMHTVFSDGDVWPTVRVQEAWMEGLDVISITDHVEYRPHSQDLDADHNRVFEIAEPLANQIGILLIKGAEITRKMPPGHLNAIFLKNANLIEREDWWEACVEAREQGAFVFWNHPGRKEQQPQATQWWTDHTRLTGAGIMKGIEIFSENEYYPIALKWADERNLTIFANSDIHAPASRVKGEKQRPVTLVFATEKTAGAVKQALLERRTAAYFGGDTIVGERRFLTPIFLNSIQVKSPQVRLQNHEIKTISIYNDSDISFRLRKRQPSVGFSAPAYITLEAHRSVAIDLEGTSDEVAQMPSLKLFYEVSNLITIKGESLPVNIDVPNR